MTGQYKVIWITGVSSGLGRELAVNYAELGVSIIISGRNEAHLAETALCCKNKGAEILSLPFDMTIDTEIEGAVKLAIAWKGNIDLLILNAGIGQRAYVHDLSMDVADYIMKVNYRSLVYITKLLLPRFLVQKTAHIAVISSVNGLYGFPLRAVYSASKHALIGFYESLALEMASKGICVTIVCPGRFGSGFSTRALDAFGKPYELLDNTHKNLLSVEKTALKVMSAIARKKYFCFFGGKELILLYLKRLNSNLFFSFTKRLNPKS
ncbi:MAG TPA: SDR family NAD(P)-dependent oxidoreductase [Bacteroidales bacterium]|nr:SDR family NAD(P)-dependent oxidoreductase [Bacteroidales bacterium]